MHLVLYLLTQPINNSEQSAVLCVSRLCSRIYLNVIYVATFCLTQLKNFDSILMWLPLHIYTEDYMASKCINCLLSQACILLKMLEVRMSNIGRILNKGP